MAAKTPGATPTAAATNAAERTPSVAKAPGASPHAVPGGENSWALPPAHGDRRLTTDITSRVTHRIGTKTGVKRFYHPETGKEIDSATQEVLGKKRDIGHKSGYEFHTTQQMARKYGLSRREVVEWENDPSHLRWENFSTNRSRKYEGPRSADDMYDEYKGWLKRQVDQGNKRLAKDPTAQRRLRQEADSGPSSTSTQRDTARDSARTASNHDPTSDSDSKRRDNGHGKSKEHKKNDKEKEKKKDKKSKKHHKKPGK